MNNKLANVKREIIGWNKYVFGRVELEIKKKVAELQGIQDSIASIEDVRKEKILREELERLLNREETMWAQKARSDWVSFGDRNSRYFQTVVRQRRAMSRIVHIKNEDGILMEDPMEVESRLVNHFKASFEDADKIDVGFILNELQKVEMPKISHNQSLDLNKPIINLEIKNNVFQLGPQKALGPDGLPTFFFQQYWEIVKSDMFNTIHSFFSFWVSF